MAPLAMPSSLEGTNGITGAAYPNCIDVGKYRVLEQYHSKPTKLRVAAIGAGASGIATYG
jgi:hypothetical protein